MLVGFDLLCYFYSLRCEEILFWTFFFLKWGVADGMENICMREKEGAYSEVKRDLQ